MSLHHEKLYIVTAISNPMRWASRVEHAISSILQWLEEPNVEIYVVECTHFGDDFQLRQLAEENHRVKHIPVHAQTLAWSKENLLNIGIARLPAEAKNIGTFDADILFRKKGWATQIIQDLHLYPVIQPWRTALDLGPQDEVMQVHTSFGYLYSRGQPVVAEDKNWWDFDGGSYKYSHSGYCMAWRRSTLDGVGGLMDFCAIGSADHHMCLSIIGRYEKSIPGTMNDEYSRWIKVWQDRALITINKKLSYSDITIEHRWHGNKQGKNGRKYSERWDMFIRHKFDPTTDLKKNSWGVVEFSGNKVELEREFDNYLKDRMEDSNHLLY